MLVDQSTQRRAILEKILRDNGYVNVFSTSGLDDLFTLVSTINPDVVLIELDSPKRDTLEQVRRIRNQRPTPVVMFAQDQSVQTVHAAVESGVCAYSVDDVDRGTVKPVIALAMATFEAYRRIRDEADALRHTADQYRNQLESRKLVDRAKGLLMKRDGLSEEEAHRTLRKMAMDQNRKLHDIVMDVLRMT